MNVDHLPPLLNLSRQLAAALAKAQTELVNPEKSLVATIHPGGPGALIPSRLALDIAAQNVSFSNGEIAGLGI